NDARRCWTVERDRHLDVVEESPGALDARVTDEERATRPALALDARLARRIALGALPAALGLGPVVRALLGHASSWCRRQSGQDAAICATRRAWPSSEPCAWRSPWAVSAWWAQQVTPDTTPGGSGVRRGRDSGCGVQSLIRRPPSGSRSGGRAFGSEDGRSRCASRTARSGGSGCTAPSCPRSAPRPARAPPASPRGRRGRWT